MTQPQPYDGTLRLTLAVLTLSLFFLWFALGGLAVGATLLGFFQKEALAELASNGRPMDPEIFYPIVLAIMSVSALVLFLGTRFLVKLRAVVRSVGEGDPFVAVNAARIRAMAWLLLAIEISGMCLKVAIGWIADKDGFEFSFTGLVAVLSLFVLARVFTQGTAMRDEIEGTV